MKAIVSLISLLLGAALFCVAITTHGMGPVSALGMLLITFSLLFPFVTGGAATPAPARAASGGSGKGGSSKRRK